MDHPQTFKDAVARYGFKAKEVQLPGERLTLGRRGTFANRCKNFSTVHEIELCYHYNGSGKDSFGGASQWPTVEAHVSFNVGEEDKQRIFAIALAKLVDEFFAQG